MDVGTGLSPFLAALQSLRAREFDRAYWQQQALAHQSSLTVEQHFAASGDPLAVRQAAIAALPLIQSDLAIADRMKAQFDGER